MTAQSGENWRAKGTLLQACNCEWGCPCNFNAPPTYGSCDGVWIAQIDEGNYGDISLDGLHFSVGAHFPEAIHLGNGEGFVFIDDQADEAQRNGLVAILTGKVGGPWAIISSLGNFQGPQFVPIEMNLDGANSSAKVGSAIELEMEPIKNPVSGADAFPGLVLPQGLLYATSTRASSKSFKVRANVEFEFSGKDAAFSPFEWSGP